MAGSVYYHFFLYFQVYLSIDVFCLSSSFALCLASQSQKSCKISRGSHQLPPSLMSSSSSTSLAMSNRIEDQLWYWGDISRFVPCIMQYTLNGQFLRRVCLCEAEELESARRKRVRECVMRGALIVPLEEPEL